jgi:hypothetical protein
LRSAETCLIMADMRLRARPSALFAVLLLLALPAVAAADPKPILKPENTTPVRPAPAQPPPAPPSPPTHTAPVNTTPASVEPAKTVAPVTHNPPPVQPSQGGRDQSGVVVTTVTPPPTEPVVETPVTVPAPDPTPLGLVSASDSGTEPSTATPPWKLALLALLAAAEAFLLVRLVRHRPGSLSPIQ